MLKKEMCFESLPQSPLTNQCFAFDGFKSDKDVVELRDMENVVDSSVKIGRSRLSLRQKK
jgi:hypothetical protein